MFLFICFVSTKHLFAQKIIWDKTFGGKHSEYLFDAIPTPDFGFLMVGSSISGKTGIKTEESKDNYDYWLWKMTENGEIEWQKSYGGNGFDYLQSIQIIPDEGLINGCLE